MMSGKERLVRVHMGKEVDRVPWSPILSQWFSVNAYHGTLPPEVSHCRSQFDLLRHMKADMVIRHEAFCSQAQYAQCRFTSTFKGATLTNARLNSCMMDLFGQDGTVDFLERCERHDRIDTPKGELTASWLFDFTAGAAFEKKHFLEDFERDYDRVRAMLNDLQFKSNNDRWHRVIKMIACDGIAQYRIPPTPLKLLHWLAGPEQAIYFIMDFPDEIMELVRIYESKLVDFVKEVIHLPELLILGSGDNMDAMMYGSPLFDDFCGHSFRRISDIAHENGKLLFTHACGQLKGVIQLCAQSGVDGMEGMAPPPLGNLEFGEARRVLGHEFIIQGGMTFHEEEMDGANARAQIFDRVQYIMEGLPDKRRFIMGSGCCPGPKAKYDNLIALRDATWTFGSTSSSL